MSPDRAASSEPVERNFGPRTKPSEADLRRWRRYLADEKAEGAVYRDLAGRRTGEERAILLALAEAEGRHEAHWRALLAGTEGKQHRGDLRTRILGFLARHFGSVFVLALAQRAESRSPYALDSDATHAMAADELVHAEVVRGLATRGRNQLSGTFRAAIFGANDGLVSNLALIMAIGAAGVSNSVVLLAGISGLLAGALSMGAGEYVSVRSQRELLEASTPDPGVVGSLAHLDVKANELTLVFRARGMGPADADAYAAEVLGGNAAEADKGAQQIGSNDDHEAIGTGLGAALSSFCFFASGAVVPIIPYLFGLEGLTALLVAAVLVGLALIVTGMVVGLLTGGPPLRRATRQLAIGYGAAALTYALGLLFGTNVA